MDDMAGAARAFAMAVELDDERADSWRDLARANLRLGNYREAVQAFERQLSLASPSVRDRLELGQAYKGASEKAKARAQFEWVISNSPDSKWAHTAQLELGSM
jgi:tetratricopeptide (TPR) repeat protein